MSSNLRKMFNQTSGGIAVLSNDYKFYFSKKELTVSCVDLMTDVIIE